MTKERRERFTLFYEQIALLLKKNERIADNRLQTVKTVKTVLTFLMDYFWGFCNGLKSNGLENLTDQRLTEVTFGVTINGFYF